MQRSNEEYMLITLSYGGSIAILPFAIIRLLEGSLLVGLVDCVMVAGMAALGSYVYITHRTKFASIVLTILALAGMSTVVYLKGPDVIFWAYPAMMGIYFILAPRMAFQLTLLTALILFPALFYKMPITTFIAVGITLVINNLFAYMFAAKMQRQQDQLTTLVSRDALTGACNRRALNEKLDEIVAAGKRVKQLVSLIVFDVDHFKAVNDTYGHPAGDQVLIRLTELILSRIRETDFLYRFGGEEFVVVLMGADINEAPEIADQLRQLIESNELIEDVCITVSLGVAEFIEGESSRSWLERADKAMYSAKQAGRNRTCIAEPSL